MTHRSTIRTIGHGTLDAAGFAALVRGAGADTIVDVRRYPGSRRFPHFAEPQMSRWVPEHGIAYRWLEALGGRRKAAPDSPNVALRNEQFRAYADHMATPEFQATVDELLTLATNHEVAVMCAESVWWRCHRKLLADHLVVIEDVPVEHIFHDGRLDPHSPMPEARHAGDHLVYDGTQGRLEV